MHRVCITLKLYIAACAQPSILFLLIHLFIYLFFLLCYFVCSFFFTSCDVFERVLHHLMLHDLLQNLLAFEFHNKKSGRERCFICCLYKYSNVTLRMYSTFKLFCCKAWLLYIVFIFLLWWSKNFYFSKKKSAIFREWLSVWHVVWECRLSQVSFNNPSVMGRYACLGRACSLNSVSWITWFYVDYTAEPELATLQCLKLLADYKQTSNSTCERDPLVYSIFS